MIIYPDFHLLFDTINNKFEHLYISHARDMTIVDNGC